MTMTTKQVLDLIAKPATGLTRGGALFQLNRINSPGHGGAPVGQRRLLEELSSQSIDSGPQIPVHPTQRARRALEERGELSAVELTWLQRLPLNPSEVTFNDAVRLAELAESLSPQRTPESARLVESVWAPVKELHDRRAADARLENARKPMPSIPAAARTALDEALKAEYPDLTAEARQAQANAALQAVVDQRSTIHANELAQAEREVEAVCTASLRRESTTFEGAPA